MNKIWQLLSSILILVSSISSIKIDNQVQIEIRQDNFKTKIINLEIIKFQTLTFNFSQFTINQLQEWIFQDINQTFKFYKIILDYQSDYNVKPIDDDTLKPSILKSTKKQNLIIMTSISILVISFLIITIVLKVRFKKGIGIKKNKKGKNSYYSANKKKKSQENKIKELSPQEKHIIKMNNKTKKRKNKTKKVSKEKKYYQI